MRTSPQDSRQFLQTVGQPLSTAGIIYTKQAMATVVPPPSKRQRTDAANRAREQQAVEEIPANAGTLRLQFFDETTGLPIGQGPVLVPVADANPKNLELLLNTLQAHVS
jgi:ribosome assembly protein 4